ncbi:hypothetical protein N7448_006759 [Penicillium atrosanguineum]|uniref:DNA-directed RNA polymerase III subunit RPC9 n=1 Tax=Penicillium atrosanguineum TaxID=1132637 RepID=A0A9W9GZ68_9EURO|nr:uncharacterized protein N7443_010520 [Penicillium atrosanguineum]KAJ5132601.1 hypothetical protein N7448_006759 [Penicillium atrosanguineum]KAJ5290267.1 hypothetical protein N7443_010520 [Penicillium atrosanguineum]KAJ5308090.1 hypothetical protein N7476_008746 [Penicillium atrosanguineum]
MRILDPQSAVLTNVEVLAYLNANPPHRVPPRPQHFRGPWVPSPDLRDHNTVVKEIHNYVSRISPHLLKYPRHASRPSSSQSHSQAAMTGTMRPGAGDGEPDPSILPEVPSNELTPMDYALRDIITKLQPYGLTKAEIVMILNLGLGLTNTADAEGHADGDGEMEVDEGHTNGVEGEEGESEEDYSAMALFDTVVEEREDRIADEDVPVIMSIIKETLAENYGEDL